MQIIHILRHDGYCMLIFKFCHEFMSEARFHVEQLLATHIIKLCYKFRIACPTFWSGDIFHVILIPQSAVIAKCADAAFCTHAGSCQDYYSHIFHHFTLKICKYSKKNEANA